MYTNRSQTHCRNGPQCRFFRRGHCWFYHPSWHENQHLDLSIEEQDEYSSESSFRFNFNFNLMSNGSSSYYMQGLSQRLKTYQLQKQMLDKPLKVQQQKIIKIGSQDVKLLKISSILQNGKSWFFQNTRHFNYFSDCQFEECSICINNYSQGDMLTLLFCNHSFHVPCIQKWLQTSDNCPLCRKDFRQHKQYELMNGYNPLHKHKSYIFNHQVLNISLSDMDESFNNFSFDEQDYSIQQENFDFYQEDHSYNYEEDQGW